MTATIGIKVVLALVIVFAFLASGVGAGSENETGSTSAVAVTPASLSSSDIGHPNDGAVPNIGVGTEPNGVAYDNATKQLFVANEGSNNVSVIPDSTNSVLTSIPVGNGPDEAVFDSAHREIFVSNSQTTSDSVSVISDSTDMVVATIHVGTNPTGEAYDPAMGEIFVTNQGSNNVSVISDATNSVVKSIPAGQNPTEIAFDTAKGEAFVANAGPLSFDVSVISDSTNTVVATIPVGSGPSGVAYDSGMGEIFVGNQGSNNVSIISDATNKVVHNIGVGTNPIGLAYDGAQRDVFVVNHASNNLSVISDVANMVVANIPIGSGPTHLAYDFGNQDVYVSNFGQGTVSIIPESSVVSATISVGTNPEGAVYDNLNGHEYVENHDSDNVSVISPATNKILYDLGPDVQGQPTYGPYALAYDAGDGGNIYTGNEKGTNTVSVIAGPSNNTDIGLLAIDPDGLAYDSGNGLIYVSDELSNDVTAINGTTNTIATGFTNPIMVQTEPGRCVYDSSNHDIYVVNQWSNDVSVISDSTNTVTATVPVGMDPVDVGFDSGNGYLYVVNRGSNNVTVISGGTNKVVTNIAGITGADGVGYSTGTGLVYVGEEKGANSLVMINGTTVVGTINLFPGVNPNTISFDAVDGLMYVTENVSDTVSVIPLSSALTVPTPIATHDPADVGQSVTFTASPYGGTAPYTKYVWTGLPPGCPPSNSKTIACTLSSVVGSPFSVSVAVTDSNSATAVSSPLPFTVDPGLKVPAPSSNHNPADVGQSVSLVASPLGGSGSYTNYAWLGLPTWCTSANSKTISCLPTTTTGSPWSISVAVTDSNSNTTTSSALSLSVDAGLLLSAVAETSPTACSASCTADQGETLSVATTASGGSGVYTFAWVVTTGSSYCSGSAAGSPKSTYSCLVGSLSATETWTVAVNVTDSNGCRYPSPCAGGALSFTVTLHQDPSLTSIVEISPSSCTVSCSADQGQKLSVSTTASGGSGGFTFTWAISTGSSYCSGSATGSITSTYSCTVGSLSTAETWNITVNVTDTAGCKYPSPCSGSTLWFKVTLYPDLSLTNILETAPSFCTSTCSADQGQELSVATTASGGSGGLTFVWVVTTGSSYCSGSASGSVTSTYSCLVGPLSKAETWNITVNATDSNGCKSPSPCAGGALSFSVTLYPDPSLTNIVMTSPSSCTSSCSADQGQELSVASTASGGSGGLTFVWAVTAGSSYCSGSASGSVTSTYSCLVGPLTKTETWNITVNVTDSDGCRSPSPCVGSVLSFSVVLYPDPSLTGIVETSPSHCSSSCIAHPTQNLSVITTASGGSGGYDFTWAVVTGSTYCSGSASGSLTSNYTCKVGSSLTYIVYWTVTVNVTDSNGCKSPGACSGTRLWFNVTLDPYANPPISAVIVRPSSLSVSTNQATGYFQANAVCTLLCPSNVTYAWVLNKPSMGTINTPTAESTTFTAGPVAGNVEIIVKATALGSSVNGSANITILSNVTTTLTSVSVTPKTDTLGTGGIASFTANVTCSSEPCPSGTAYAWSLNNSLGSLSSAVGSSTTLTAGTKPGVVSLTVNATLNGVTRSASAAITISSSRIPEITSVAVSPAVVSISVNTSMSMWATPSCGSDVCPPGITYSWSMNNPMGELNTTHGSVVGFTAGASPGTLTVFVNATLNGITASATATITITSNVPQHTTQSGSGISWWWIVAAVTIAIVAALCLYFGWWTRRKEEPLDDGGLHPASVGSAASQFAGPGPAAPMPPRAPAIAPKPQEEWREDSEPNPPARAAAVTRAPVAVTVVSGGPTEEKEASLNPIDAFNFLNVASRGPQKPSAFWGIDVFGAGGDRRWILDTLTSNGHLSKEDVPGTGVMYTITDRGREYMAQVKPRGTLRMQRVSGPLAAAPAGREGEEPQPEKHSPGPVPGAVLEGTLGETRAEENPFEGDIKPEEVNPNVQHLDPKLLQPMEMRIDPDRGTDVRETVPEKDADTRAKELMERAQQSKKKRKSRYGVEQAPKPGDKDQE
jgi:YVTN family beta-propeller protein